MNEIALSVEGLGKRYQIGSAAEPYRTLREVMAGFALSPLASMRKRASHLRPGHEDPASIIWALRDVSFSVKKGEALGIIGRNGAGKSTLLKLLSRITVPTTGTVRVAGRVGALLEVGTGFHPELTGRENVYLNGAILGMSRRDIEDRFEEIVGFAETERFIDTPVKRYSSGMQLRLAFAVAAHLQPDILLADEVLAVGDAAFQRKCLGKMGEAAYQGRTVLFVSHNLQAIKSLCANAIRIEEGRIVDSGPSEEVVDRYQMSSAALASGTDLRTAPRRGEVKGDVIMRTVKLEGGSGPGIVRLHEPMAIEIEFDVRLPVANIIFGATVYSVDDAIVMQSLTSASYPPVVALEPGRYLVEGRFQTNVLAPGKYWIELTARDERHQQDLVPRALGFEVIDQEVVESPWFAHTVGYVRVSVDWSRPVSVAATEGYGSAGPSLRSG